MKNKVVAITGASSGIGEALAKEFASKGFDVAICARRVERLEEVKKALEKYNVKVACVKADVSIETECENFISESVEQLGQIDVLINNAGISMRAVFKDVELSVVKRLMDINFWGAIYCTKYALPHLLKTKGSVIGISSIAGFTPLPARVGYCASKYALHGFLETLRVENFNTGLHVMLVAPNYTSSEIRKTALVADGSSQGETPRKEEKMMTSERVAEITYKGYLKKKRTMVLTPYGRLIVFVNKWWPSLVNRTAFKNMIDEPDSPLAN